MIANGISEEEAHEHRTFEVFVDDNFHYMDEDERYSAGVFRTYDTALKRAKRIVDKSLSELWEPGMDTGDLMARYVMFGEDPWISPTPTATERFSARDYARVQARAVVSHEGT